VLHGAARRAPGHLVLDLDEQSGPVWRLHHEGTADAVIVAAVASRCILFLGGEDAGRVRRCARPACPMLFVQHHRARRFCHDTCAHSVRQARYYRSARDRS
jgi:predicted RNA-binding Zn ribbon-like protein